MMRHLRRPQVTFRQIVQSELHEAISTGQLACNVHYAPGKIKLDFMRFKAIRQAAGPLSEN
jgi:hypothetical protein